MKENIPEKKNQQIGIRIDASMAFRLEQFETDTGITPSALARSALEAALDSYEAFDELSFPLICISRSQWKEYFSSKSKKLKK